MSVTYSIPVARLVALQGYGVSPCCSEQGQEWEVAVMAPKEDGDVHV